MFKSIGKSLWNLAMEEEQPSTAKPTSVKAVVLEPPSRIPQPEAVVEDTTPRRRWEETWKPPQPSAPVCVFYTTMSSLEQFISDPVQRTNAALATALPSMDAKQKKALFLEESSQVSVDVENFIGAIEVDATRARVTMAQDVKTLGEQIDAEIEAIRTLEAELEGRRIAAAVLHDRRQTIAGELEVFDGMIAHAAESARETARATMDGYAAIAGLVN